MANNRIYLRCKCNKDEGIFLGKRFGGDYHTENYQHKNGLIDRLNLYYNKHEECLYGLDLDNDDELFDNHYYLDYEFKAEDE